MTAVAPSATPHAAGRAVEPRAQGYLDRDGVRIFYELFGDAPETILFLPPWAINHSRFWKGQVPYLSRHFSVLTFDPRGNGRSDRPESPDEYGAEVTAADAFALLDELGLDRVFLVVHCGSADKGLLLTAHHPERFVGAVFMSPALPITPPRPERVTVLHRAAPDRRGLGEAEPPLLAARLSRLPGVLLRPLLHGAALHEADRGRHRLGARDDTGHARAHRETVRIRRGDVRTS